MKTRLARALGAVVRAPATHFFVIGAVAFAAASVVDTRGAAAVKRPPIVISAARVAEIRDDYIKTFHRVPSSDEIHAFLQQAADEEMLYREALVVGFDRNDRAIGWRILDKMHFLYGDSAGDAATAYKRGIALGLQQEDPIVRNALITKMKLVTKSASRANEPTGPALDRALEDYKDRHPEEFTRPSQVSLTHVFLSDARHGADVDRDARALLAELRDGDASVDAAMKRSDAFPAGLRLRHIDRTGLVKLFGSDFADAVARLEPGRWTGPIRSPFGLHLVLVQERTGATTATLQEVRERALRGFRAERHQEYLDKLISELRQAYEVRIESDATARR